MSLHDEEQRTSATRKRSRPNFYSEEISDPAKKVRNKRTGKQEQIHVEAEKQPIPVKDAQGFLIFPNFPEFRPNLTPKEVLQLGSFGGTYFRGITSSITNEMYKDVWKEFPDDWFEGLNIPKRITSKVYDNSVNTYKVSCGGDLKMWEESGWITEIDPYGWFQWYCRFYLGRRCSDDLRQISRALGVMGPTGRWKRNLMNKCLQSGKPLDKVVDDVKISPKVRQLLQHWGYKLTLSDLKKASK